VHYVLISVRGVRGIYQEPTVRFTPKHFRHERQRRHFKGPGRDKNAVSERPLDTSQCYIRANL